ncbi:MAG TPA: zinc ribbon domain-containing protein [Pyrinomonadaceae bacterium]|jgi:hypothetical protein
MFCPKCGQQQADQARFCSRCGLGLTSVGELIMRGGQLPVWATAESGDGGPARRESPKRRGIRQGARMMFLSIFLIPMIAIIHRIIGLPAEFILFGVLLFMGGLMRLLYSLVFAESAPAQARSPLPAYAPPNLMSPLGAARQDALPPPQGAPVYDYRPPQMHTAEMQPPPSVTDHTTRLLDKQNEPDRRDS